MIRLLAEGIQSGFLGAGGLQLTDLLQRASARLAAQHGDWPAGLGGLLLAELDVLLRWGVADAGKANALAAGEMAVARAREFEVLSPPPDPRARDNSLSLQVPEPGDQPIEERFTARLEAAYAADGEWAQGPTLTTTGLRATAMALVFAELLSVGGLLMGPQVLSPWEPDEDGG